MYAARASQFAKTITMACSVQKQPSQPAPHNTTTTTPQATSPASTSAPTAAMAAITAAAAVPSTPKGTSIGGSGVGGGQRGSLTLDAHQQPTLEFQWPTKPVSTHTSNLRLNMMNQNPKDLHTARLIIEELRTKVRYQTEHIMKWRKAYALQIQQHYRYQKEKTDQMNALTSQLLLLESRLKRKQKQISSLLSHRELTIQRQQRIIDTLSTRLVDHGLETIEASYATELDSLNDSDSAVVLEEIDSDSNMTLGTRRKSSGGSGGGGDSITIVRSISDAIETNLNKYAGVRRNNCFLRRPEILETVYSVEEDPEPTSDVAEKRDKFRNRSEKALSSSSTEGQIDNVAPLNCLATTTVVGCSAGGSNITNKTIMQENTKEPTAYYNNCNNYKAATTTIPKRQLSSPTPLQESPTKDGYTACIVKVPQLRPQQISNKTKVVVTDDAARTMDGCSPVKSQVTNFNRVMSNHRSVTKPKDVKYKRINKAKSKSLEELRGRLKNLVERGSGSNIDSNGFGAPKMMTQTAQSYA